MSSSLVERVEATVDGRRPSGRRARRRTHGRINKAWIWGHRWASLVLGLVLLAELTSGAILLYANTFTEWLEPDRYVATPSATPLDPLQALRTVQAEHPEIAATYARIGDSGVVTVSGDAGDTAFVDSGTGRVIDVGEDRPWILRLLVNLHDCALTCEGYPGYQGWLAATVPWSEEMTVGGFVLGSLGVVLLFLVVSGAITWWPGLKAWVLGFVVRRGRGAYVRDLDLHRVVGIVSVPFLFMWAFTGSAFEFQWPEKVYAALLPGEATPDPELTHGTGPLISVEQAVDTARAAHPGTTVTSIYVSTPEEPEGSYGVGLDDGGYSPYRYSGGGTQTVWVDVDSHGGGTVEYQYGFTDGGPPLAQQLWDNGTYFGLHFGQIVPGVPRIVWLVFGLAPVLLGITGVTIWLTKRRSSRNRKLRRRATAA